MIKNLGNGVFSVTPNKKVTFSDKQFRRMIQETSNLSDDEMNVLFGMPKESSNIPPNEEYIQISKENLTDIMREVLKDTPSVISDAMITSFWDLIDRSSS